MSSITINLLDRGTLPLFLPNTATVFNIKEAVAQHIGKTPNQFLAVSRGQELKDYEQLCNIPGVYSWNTIHVVERQDIKNECVEIETAEGKHVTLQVNQDDTIDSVWSKIKTEPNESSEKENNKKHKRGTYTKRACVHCRNAHAACDEGRPCKRCRTMGLQCIDAERKPRKKQNFSESAKFESLADYIPALAALPSEELKGSEDNQMINSASPSSSSSSFIEQQPSTASPQNQLEPVSSPFTSNSSNSSIDHIEQQQNNTESNESSLKSNINFNGQSSNTDALLRQVVSENARQAQELVELRLLVRQLCQMLIESGEQPQTSQTKSQPSSLIS